MNFRSLHPALKPALLFALVAGCNIFNPSGEGEADPSNIDAMLSRAENLYRRAQYTEAAAEYERIIRTDSTRSMAYFGLAKANLRRNGVNPLTFLGVLSVDSSEIPFMAETQETKNQYYQASRLVLKALDPLVLRDTLTAIWENTRLVAADPAHMATLTSAEQAAVQRFQTSPPADLNRYPLTDRVIRYSRFSLDFTLTSFSRTMLGFLDINRDSIIDSRDFNLRIYRDSSGNVALNVDEIMVAAASDPAVAQSLNDNVDALASGTADLSELITSMSATLGMSEDSVNSQLGDQAGGSMEQQIADLGDQVRFYKLGDGKDNDGDGCIDEEIYDGIDNDGDGLIDEDLRLIPLLNPDGTPNLTGVDFRDNNGDGVIDGANEALDENGVLHFVQGFVANDMGELNSTDRERKLAVAQDTTGIMFNLVQRQQHIGGCWTYYNEDRFQALFR